MSSENTGGGVGGGGGGGGVLSHQFPVFPIWRGCTTINKDPPEQEKNKINETSWLGIRDEITKSVSFFFLFSV